MENRTLGWVQNPSDFDHLRNTLALFVPGSDVHNSLVNGKLQTLVQDTALRTEMLDTLSMSGKITAKYSLLRGKGKGSAPSRKQALCTGIVQAVIPAQGGRAYTDDWTADGFLRWAISVGLLVYEASDDTVSISDLGVELVEADSDSRRDELLVTAFLSYPPAIRVLSLLNASEAPMTKFELGRELGGLGEPGFTSIPQDLFVQAICTAHTAEERNKLRSNAEGSSDKYARMISSWLVKVELVQKVKKEVTVEFGGQAFKETLVAYRLTLEGRKALTRSKGGSSSAHIPKKVYWEMLATKVQDRDYVRTRRARIIEAIKGKYAGLEKIQKYLREKGITESLITIKDELAILEAMGLTIEKNERKQEYRCPDDILYLAVPTLSNPFVKTDVLKLKDEVREKLQAINHRYLALIELAYLEGKSSSRDFEVLTVELLVKELLFQGVHLGGSRKPDGIIYYDHYGVILDTKAYSDGYSLPISHADEMVRYIEENKNRSNSNNPTRWWEAFGSHVNDFYYLFITSAFKGTFEQRLRNIHERTHTNGGGISVANLLYLAEALKTGEETYKGFIGRMRNEEITIS